VAPKWTGEAGKVRRRVLGAVDRGMKKKVGESDLGRLYSGDSSLLSGWSGSMSHSEGRDHNQAALYAVALGVTFEDAQARIARQHELVGDRFIPGKGYVTV